MDLNYVKIFKAFTDESRVRVLELLMEGEECACVLLDDLQISQPTLSHHMKILCDSGIVKSRRVGKWNYYSINKDGCQKACRLIERIGSFGNIDRTIKFMVKIYGIRRGLRKILGLSNEYPKETTDACNCRCAFEEKK